MGWGISRRTFLKVLSSLGLNRLRFFQTTSGSSLLTSLTPESLIVQDHNHQSVEMQGHEHDVFVPVPIVNQRVIDLIGNVIAESIGDDFERRNSADWLLNNLETSFREIDHRIQSLPRIALGDMDELMKFRAWLEAEAAPNEDNLLVRDQIEDERSLSNRGNNQDPFVERIGIPLLDEDLSSWINGGAVLDLYLGASFVALGDPELRNQYLQTTTDYLRGRVAALSYLYQDVYGVLNNTHQPDELILTIDNLINRDIPLPPIPNEFDVCLMELQKELSRPANSIATNMGHSANAVNDNTSRIVRVSPNPVCVGDTLTIFSDPSNPFDTMQSQGVGVLFTPCGVLGDNVNWQADKVTVTVPQQATSGSVYFGSLPSEPLVPQDDIAAVIGGCFLFLNARSFMTLMYPRLPFALCQDFIATTARNTLQIFHPPRFAQFHALDSNTAVIGERRVPPQTQISLYWNVESDASGQVNIRILTSGQELHSTNMLVGSFPLTVAETQTFIVEATNICGTTVNNVTVYVKQYLTWQPSELRLFQGQTATITLIASRTANVDRSFIIYTSESDRVPLLASGIKWDLTSATIHAGQTQTTIQVLAEEIGEPGQPTSVLSVAPPPVEFNDYERNPLEVWVELPMGSTEIMATGPGTTGPQPKIGVVGVHAALLNTGKVLLFAYNEADWAKIDDANSAVWDPVSGNVTNVFLQRNLFCAGHCFLGDGRLFVAGGQSTFQRPEGIFWTPGGADHDLHTFNPATEQWGRHFPNMPAARWYPTCTTLPNGRALVLSGYSSHLTAGMNYDYEIFDGAQNRMITKRPLTSGVGFDLGLYPFVQVLPGGTLFVHSYDLTVLFQLNSATSEPQVNPFVPAYRTRATTTRTYDGQGACVLLPLSADDPNNIRVMVMGGGGDKHGKLNPSTPATQTAEIFEFDPSTGSRLGQKGWRSVNALMTTFRFMADAVLLPDGTVAIIGGVGAGRADNSSGSAVMWVESFDPDTETFTAMSSLSVPRFYHSTALLLPDGSVLVAGSTGRSFHFNQGGGSQNEYRLEVYHPPYSFRGPKPRFQISSTSIRYNQPFQISVTSGDAQQIQKVALLRLGSTTHTNNMDQRYVGLSIISNANNTLLVQGPGDGTVAPPGPYLLFVIKVVGPDISQNRIPSIGTMVHIA